MIIGTFLALIILGITAVLSWLFTCGVVYLITLCFGLTFNWAIATGIWLILVLVTTAFRTIIKLSR